MTINERTGCSSSADLTNALRSDQVNDHLNANEDNIRTKSFDDKSLDPRITREETPFLTINDNAKIAVVIPNKFRASRTSLTTDNYDNTNEPNGRKERSIDLSSVNGDDGEHLPPDGGIRAWMIMLGSFMINGILFSVINTYSLIYVELQKQLEESGETDASSKAALVGSLTIGTTFFLSPIAGILTDKFGIQLTTFLGGAIAFGGMLLASLFAHKVEVLYLTYGVMYGFGASLAYTPSLVILGHYFKRYLGLVNGIVTAGSSVFTIIMPYVIEPLLKRFGLVGTLRSLAVLTSVVMACAVLFKPVPRKKKSACIADDDASKVNVCSRLKEVVNVSIWKKKKYVVWASAIPLALFGYFVPYVHIGKFVSIVFEDADKKLPVMCIGITSGIGRLVFGFIADLPRVNRILLQQISFVSIGVLTMLLPVTPTFGVLLLIALCMGLFDGCFISLLGPIAFDICGQKGATQAIGFLLGMCSVPLTVGPPIAGQLYDRTGSYELPFILAGVPPIVGAIAMFLVRCVKEEDGSKENSPEDQQRLRNGITEDPEKSSGMTEIVVSARLEGRSWTEKFRCKLLETSSRIPNNKPNWRQSRCLIRATSYDVARSHAMANHEYFKHQGRADYSESAPLLIGINGMRPEFGMRTKIRLARTSRSCILLTC